MTNLKRKKAISVKVSKQEQEKINQKSEALGLNTSSYLRILAQSEIDIPLNLDMDAAQERSELFNTRITPEEYNKIVSDADKLGLTMSDYIRILLLNTEITINVKVVGR